MADPLTIAAYVVAAFAGGLFGAAIGALPAFAFTGFMVIAGEAARLVGGEGGAPAALGATGVTGEIAFGAFFGPHIAFAAGAAASAYAAKKGYAESDWGYHDATNILMAFGTHHKDVLVVGGLFGVLGYVVFYVSSEVLAAPWDPIAMGVVLSALGHRVAFGYSIFGTAHGDGFLDLSPFEREETVATDGAAGQPVERLVTEPWLPWQYEWSSVALLGFGVGVLGGFTYYFTASPFLAFGISAASLAFLNLGIDNNFAELRLEFPVTHHITLPASTAPMAYAGLTLGATPETVASSMLLFEAVALGAVFGILGALFGELAERLFYAHGDTHWDPPATSIVVTTFIIAVLAIAGVFPGSGWVPVPI